MFSKRQKSVFHLGRLAFSCQTTAILLTRLKSKWFCSVHISRVGWVTVLLYWMFTVRKCMWKWNLFLCLIKVAPDFQGTRPRNYVLSASASAVRISFTKTNCKFLFWVIMLSLIWVGRRVCYVQAIYILCTHRIILLVPLLNTPFSIVVTERHLRCWTPNQDMFIFPQSPTTLKMFAVGIHHRISKGLTFLSFFFQVFSVRFMHKSEHPKTNLNFDCYKLDVCFQKLRWYLELQ